MLLSRLFEKKQSAGASGANPIHGGVRYTRHSGGWAWLRQRLQNEPGLRVIDTGFTSPTNINYLTGLGHSVFLADLVGDARATNWVKGIDDDGEPIWDEQAYIEKTMNFAGRMFDVALLWTDLDYLPEPLVVPVVSHLYKSMNKGGQVLAFFHTRTQGDETAYCRFHLTPGDEVEMQFSQEVPIQRAFTNRSIERLFSKWGAYRQFLAKDSLSEAIITR